MSLPSQPSVTNVFEESSKTVLRLALGNGSACLAEYKVQGSGTGTAVVCIVSAAAEMGVHPASRVGPGGGGAAPVAHTAKRWRVQLPAVAPGGTLGDGAQDNAIATLLAGDTLLVPGDRVNRPAVSEGVLLRIVGSVSRVGGHWNAEAAG